MAYEGIGTKKAPVTSGALHGALAGLFDLERDRWILWAPVLASAGAGIYYGLQDEPGPGTTAVLAAGSIAIAFVAWWRGFVFPAILLTCLAAGFALAMAQAHLGGTPTVAKRTGTVDVAGWVESTDERNFGQRIVLLVKRIDDWPRDSLPVRVRLNVYGADELKAGDAIVASTRLAPIPGPVAPGGFDFARRAWFERIGASGQVFGAVEEATDIGTAPFAVLVAGAIDRLRRAVAARILVAAQGQASAFLVAVTTGARGGLDDDTVDALRAAGLAHLLAISGLHMALVGSTMFALTRAFLALFPYLALNFAIKKWAAVAALLLACAYLLLSGASVSTQRAFIMIAIMFVAILLDRPAISIRNVAVAAIIILVLRPHSVVDVSFQMSFLTVLVLVSFYEWFWRRRRTVERVSNRSARRGAFIARRTVFYFAGILMTTVLAGFATAPVAAYHFHTLASYSVLGNLVAVPLMGVVVMPFALLAILAMPLGGEQPFLFAAARGTELILGVSEKVEGLPGALAVVGALPAWAGLITVSGMLWLSLWRGRVRLAGIVAIAAGVACSGLRETPDLLIEREAKVMALRNGAGELVLTTARAGRFAAERWLLADGDSASPSAAAARDGLVCDGRGCAGSLRGGIRVHWVSHAEALWDACRDADIVVAQIPVGAGCQAPALVIDWWDIYDGGSHVLYVRDGEPVVRNARDLRGVRPWMPSGDEIVVLETSGND